MPVDSAPIDLTHHFLIAMPGLEDEFFAGSVVYVCEHHARGALGIIVNKPSGMTLADLFQKIELPLGRPELADEPVLRGGPLQNERGFVLHDPVLVGDTEAREPVYASTLSVPGGLDMTTSRDVLEAMSTGAGPRRVRVSVGYASWGEGQLESELAENAWLTVPADPDVIFESPLEARYERALALLGLRAWMLSPEAGHA